MDIARNIENLKEKVNISAESSGRKGEDISIIAVSKSVGIKEINDAYNYGLRDFGENRVQDLLIKEENISKEDLNWHLIGHLQRNKVKPIIDKVKLIHSLDSIRLAKEIERQARSLGKTIDCLLQINVAKEEQKFGLNIDDIDKFLEECSKMSHIKLKGLMCMAPFGAKEGELREVFSKTRQIYVDISENTIHNVDMVYLSMGMTDDFEIAIEEGSNMIRVGRYIFH